MCNPKNKQLDELLSSSFVNKRILQWGIVASCCVVGMVIGVYTFASPEDIKHLSKAEKDAARISFFVMTVNTVLVGGKFIPKGQTSGPSAIVVTALLINCCTMLCNGLLAFAPVVTMIDPVLGTKIHLIRWCEWIPLAGLMTYISDIVSLRKKEGDIPAVLSGLSQAMACIPAILFPFAQNATVWSIELCIAVAFYLYMFPRLWKKYRIIKDTTWGESYDGQVYLSRHNFGFHLFGVCAALWSLLVIMFFVNAFAVNFLSKGHLLRHEANQVWVDSTFDVIAKAFYCRLIVDVHFAAFQKERVS